jgi:hypothetical protein
MNVKTRLLGSLLAGLVGASLLGPLIVRADLEVSGSVNIHATADFYAPLAPAGAWIEVDSYGRCWRPAGVAVDWRPYGCGHWVWTDCGWYWASDEPWAWACYHYGWWVYDPLYMWVWVPGIEWGPAWVSWRVGAGYIGWAPLPPRGVKLAVGAPDFVFVSGTRFQEPVRPATLVVNNTTVFKQTAVINNVSRESRNIGGTVPQKVVVNTGPGVEVVQNATGRTIKAEPIREAARQTPVPSHFAAGRSDGRNQGDWAPFEPSKSGPNTKLAPEQNRGRPPQPLAPGEGPGKHPQKPPGGPRPGNGKPPGGKEENTEGGHGKS